MKGGGGGKRKYIKKYTEPISEQGSLYGGGSATIDSCKSILFNTQLQKVTPAIKALLPNDELSIRNSKSELQAINTSGDVCGSIVSSANPRILECMGRGYSFKSVVNSISGSVCKVTVQIA